MFARTYKGLKSIPPKLIQHIIELNTSIPPTHQARYKLNPNYVVVVEQDIGVGVRMNSSKLVDTSILDNLREKIEQCFNGSNLGHYDVR